MPSEALSIRRFRWDDVPTIAALQQTEPAALERWLGQPNLVPTRDCLLAEAGGIAAGYAYVVVEQAISRAVLIFGTGQAAPSATAGALIDAAVDHATTLGLVVLHVDVPETDREQQALCSSAGMVPVRTHLHMRRDGATTIGVAPSGGMTLRMASHEDVVALTELQNAAFTGSWGYAPNTPDEINYRVFDLPGVGPDGVLLLEAGGELTGYCWTHQETPGAHGIIDMVGVLPSRQGHGIGLAVTAAGLDHLIGIGAVPVEITVDSENPPAIRVYERLGFATEWRSVWYEARLTPSR